MNSGTLTEASERGTDGEVSKEPSGIENLAERDWPPVTLQDLPPPPPLRNIDRAKGSIVPLRVFGFAVPWSDLAVLAQNRGYNDGKHQFGGSARAWNDVQNHAKPWCDRYSIVKDGRMTAMCLVLATNRTEENMTKMKDIETIEAVRKVVGIGRMPEWYKTTGWNSDTETGGFKHDANADVDNCGSDTQVSKSPTDGGNEGPPEKDWPPVTLQNLPSPPLIRNLDRSKGPLVRFRVFGFAVLWSELAVMAKRLGYDNGKHQMGGSARVWKELQIQAAPWCRRYSVVKAGEMTSMCLVLATNRTAEDLAKREDIEAIVAVRQVIGLGRMPKWYVTMPT